MTSDRSAIVETIWELLWLPTPQKLNTEGKVPDYINHLQAYTLDSSWSFYPSQGGFIRIGLEDNISIL